MARPMWLLTVMAITGVVCIVLGYHETQVARKWPDAVTGMVLTVAGFLMAAIAAGSLGGW